MNQCARARDPAEELNLTSFIGQHGRLPRLGDQEAPWRFRGWLLAYVIQLHAIVPAVADRWGYHLRTLEAGTLLDVPIPQIAFGPAETRIFSLLHRWSRLIGWDCGGWSDFRTLVDWLSWGLALNREITPLREQVHEQLYRQVDLGPLLARPYDYLGEHVAMSKARGWNPTGFFPTPHAVVELMVRMTTQDQRKEGHDSRAVAVCDPCVGSGRMLLHASNYSLCLYGQDIDPLAVAMCKINGALYAPWLSFPLPASILGTNGKTGLPSPSVSEATGGVLPLFRVNDRGQGLLFGP
jgi:hypothetical protein